MREGVMKALDQVRIDKPDGLVIFGDGKNFSAGADIAEFSKGKHLIRPGLTDVIAALDDVDRPVLACINGVALGGGLEVALSCHWRYASPTALVGLPEVHLGILPGGGGTQRLPRLIGVEKALELMVSGRNVSAAEALKLGILDGVATKPFANHDELIDAADEFIKSERVRSTPIRDRKVSSRIITGIPADALDKMEASVKANSRGFSAPINIAKAARAAVEVPTFEGGLARERELFTELSKGSQASAMQYQFFAERSTSNPPAVPDSSKVPQVSSVGIIGGGTMGAGIAMCFAEAGLSVTLVETSAETAVACRNRIEKVYKASSAYKSGKMTDDSVNKLLGMITFSSDMQSLNNADMVIEAVFENMNTKKEIFTKLDRICKPGAILATNTSYLDIDEIASVTSRIQNVIGTHFFSPANVMKLLEVIRGSQTSLEVISACMQIGKKIKKQPVLSGNCFGFIGNRMLEFYGKEALFLIEEGATPAQVDRVLKTNVGMAMGFFEMSDLAGNDVGWRLRQGFNLIGENASGRLPHLRYSCLSDKLCERGWFGQKTSRGWYLYDPAAPRKPLENPDTLQLIRDHRSTMGTTERQVSDQEVVERTLYAMVNEGYRILEEGIAAGPADIDVVYVYGYGFPRYRGGPMWWAEQEVGLEKVLEALNRYSEKYPKQPYLKPTQLLVDAVQSKRSIQQTLNQLRGAKK